MAQSYNVNNKVQNFCNILPVSVWLYLKNKQKQNNKQCYTLGRGAMVHRPIQQKNGTMTKNRNCYIKFRENG